MLTIGQEIKTLSNETLTVENISHERKGKSIVKLIHLRVKSSNKLLITPLIRFEKEVKFWESFNK